MINRDDATVMITIDSEDLIRSIALLEGMRDFCKEQDVEGVKETTEALTTAVETMKAFWCEHFEGED